MRHRVYDAAVGSVGYKAEVFLRYISLVSFHFIPFFSREQTHQYQYEKFELPVPYTKSDSEVTYGFGRTPAHPPNQSEYPQAWPPKEKVAGIRF